MSRPFVKLILLISVATLALSAPSNLRNDEDKITVEDDSKKDINDGSKIDELKKVVDDKISNDDLKKGVDKLSDEKLGNEKIQDVPEVTVSDEKVKENLDKNGLNSKDQIEKVIDSVSEKKKLDTKKSPEEDMNNVLASKNPEDKVDNFDMMIQKDMKTVLKVADEMVKKTDDIVMDIKDSIEKSEDPLKIVDSKLRDVASAVAEAVTNLPIPGKPDTPAGNKFTQIFGHFVNELMQVPMVILHAISNAISGLTSGTSTKPLAP